YGNNFAIVEITFSQFLLKISNYCYHETWELHLLLNFLSKSILSKVRVPLLFNERGFASSFSRYPPHTSIYATLFLYALSSYRAMVIAWCLSFCVTFHKPRT